MKVINESVFKTPIFQEFIKIPHYQKLLSQYEKEPTPQNQKNLEEAFQNFSRKAIAISYLKKVIYYESRNFDKKIRNEKVKELLILNQPIEDDLYLIDLIEDESSCRLENQNSTNLNDYINDLNLLNAINKLTPKQRKVIYLYFVKEWKEHEIAKEMKISQQAISKLIRKAIKILKEEIL